MASDFETQFITAADKPALIACSKPELVGSAKSALRELNYKCHTVTAHGPFVTRFSQVRYQVVVLEELFAATTPEENLSLIALQKMAMNQRRHATVILLGENYVTFDPMQAFQLSVHAVINISELALFKQLVEKAVADNNLFLQSFREVQSHLSRL
jgi:hypothetical protein